MWRIIIGLLLLLSIGVNTEEGTQQKQDKIQVKDTIAVAPVPSLNNTGITNNKTAGPALPITQNTTKVPARTIKTKTILVDGGRALTEPALYRLFYVLLGISTLTICYVIFRLYRVRNGGTRPTAVRKYGVLAQRSDIEMEPLHLDDEDDDDTVFERGAHGNR